MQQPFAQSIFSKGSLFAFVGASKNNLTWMRLLFIFLMAGGATNSFSQVIAPNHPASSPQFAGCDDLNPIIDNYEPCCYRLHIDNTSDCYPSLRLDLDGGSFASWVANTPAGWTATLVNPSEILLTHSSGQVPIGGYSPISFCLVPGTSPELLLNWEFTCVPAASCIAFFQLDGCPDPNDASITGVKYRECGSSPYINQPVIPGWTMSLLDINGNTISQQQTASDGTYGFYDLPGGTYTVKEGTRAGWSATVPASGQATVNLIPSQKKVQNFGNCPSCSCDSIYMNLSQLAGTSDTSTYFLTLSNNGAYCFSYVNIQYDTIPPKTKPIDWSLLLPGWTAVLQGPSLLKLSPPGPLLPGGGNIPLSFRVSGAGVHKMTVSTFWNTGGGNIPCNRTFVFQNPPEVLSLDCCPAGTEQGSELVLDGNFISTPPLFNWSNDYINAPLNGPGHIAVVKSKDIPAINPVWACASKSGSPDDRFLIVDASTTAGAVAWEQQLTTTPGTEYAYGAFLNNIVIPNVSLPNPNVRLQIVDGGSGNNVLDAATKNLSQSPDNWVSLCGHWKSPEMLPTTPYKLQIVAVFPVQLGHDFAVDCISFRSCLPVVPCSVSIATTPLAECGPIQWTANATGPTPYTYLWSNGQSTQTIIDYQPCGTYTVTVTCADGMTATATSVVISDNIKPTISCPNDLKVQGYTDGNGTCQSVVTGIGANAADNCPVTFMSYSINGPPELAGNFTNAYFNEGISTVIHTVTDWCGNTASCSYKVTVECHSCYCADVQGPELVTNGDFSNGGGFFSDYTNNCISTAQGQYCITSNPITANPIFESCDDMGMGNMLVVNGASDPAKKVWCSLMPMPVIFGTNYFFRYELTSVAGFDPAQLQLSINGANVGSIAQSPFNPCFWQQFCQPWTPPDMTVTSANVCLNDLTSVAAGNDFALDNISFRSCSTPTCNPDFSWVSDPCLNTQFFNNSTPSSGLSYLWTFGDNTGSSTLGNPVHSFPNCGTYTVCLTIVGPNCEKTICKEVTVADNVPPTITCPPDRTFECDDNTSDPGQATATDNCGAPTVSGFGHVALNPCGSGSIIAKIWTATDACGNSSSCVQTVTYQDTKPPVLTNCPPDKTVGTDPGKCYYSGPVQPPTVTDNCDQTPTLTCVWTDPQGTTMPLTPLTQFPKGGTNTIRCVAEDHCGNISVPCFSHIIVFDNQPPTITCPGNISVLGTIDAQGQCKAVVNGIAPTASDNCPMLNLSYLITPMGTFGLGDASGTNFMEGNSTVTYTATDMGGNTASCSFVVSVSCQPVCECGTFSNMNWRPVPGGPQYPITCGDILTVGCLPPSFDLVIGGGFQCQGNCAQLYWELRQVPSGSLVATGNAGAGPGFGIVLDPSYFTHQGMFELTIRGFCNNTLCTPCVFKINAQGCPCCNSYGAFLNLVNQGFTVTKNFCTVTVCAPQFSGCHWLTMEPNFGDGFSVPGPVPAHGCWTHTYKHSGTYYITAKVFENDCWGESMEAKVTVYCTPFGISTIRGTVYDAGINGLCTQEPYTNQPTLTGWTVTLADTSNTIIATALTDNVGSYRFDSLPPGIYRVVENAEPDWEYCIPASGSQTVSLDTGELRVDFGNHVPDLSVCAEACPGNRSWDQLIDQFNGIAGIYAMTVFNGKLIVAGYNLFQIGNTQVTEIAAWDGNTWSALGNGLLGPVSALAVRNGKLYAGGQFQTPGSGIAVWDGSSWSALDGGVYQGFPQYNGWVHALLNTPFGLVVGGNFNSVGSSTSVLANNIGLWNDATNKWMPYFGQGVSSGGGAYEVVRSLGLYKGNVVAGGDFSSPAKNIAMFDQASASWRALGGGADGEVLAILQNGNDLIVGGTFFAVKNVYNVAGTNGIASWDGSQWKSMASGAKGFVHVLKNFDGALFAGGDFTIAAPGVKKWDGTNWTGTGHSYEIVNALEKYSPSAGICDFYSGAINSDNNNARLVQRWSCTVGTEEAPSAGIRLFPNPTTGDLNIELPSPATLGMHFRIIDLIGRLLLEKQTETGNAQQAVRTGDLPNGLYFLQVISEGKVLAVKKFVKQ